MVLGLILRWTVKALDFDNAFVQAAIDHEVFAFLPRGYYSLNKTQFGQGMSKIKKSPFTDFPSLPNFGMSIFYEDWRSWDLSTVPMTSAYFIEMAWFWLPSSTTVD
jgi:hypothetical protein